MWDVDASVHFATCVPHNKSYMLLLIRSLVARWTGLESMKLLPSLAAFTLPLP